MNDFPFSLFPGIAAYAASTQPCGRPIPTDDDAALHEAEAAYLEGLSVKAMQDRRRRGDGPRYYKMGKGKRAPVRYTRRLLRENREAHLRRSTSDQGGEAA